MPDFDLSSMQLHLASLGRAWTPADVADVLRAQGHVVSDVLVVWITEQLRLCSIGAGPLEELLRTPGVTDVLVNGPDQVWIDRGSGLERSQVRFESDSDVRALAARLAASVGRRLDDATPCVDARLRDGTRLHAVLGSLAAPGTCLSLRVPSSCGLSFDDLVGTTIPPALAEHVRQLIASRVAFLISGGTGSGKTTLLGALLGLIDDGERLVIVEDSRELRPHHVHTVSLEGRPANSEGAGAVPMSYLVRQALRMRPDRVVVGEVRGGELCDLLMALNTGHEGGCGTVHANSARDVPARLEALAALGGMARAALTAQVAAALQVIVHVHRGMDGRREISQIGVLRRAGDEMVCEMAVDNHGGQLDYGPAWGEFDRLVAR